VLFRSSFLYSPSSIWYYPQPLTTPSSLSTIMSTSSLIHPNYYPSPISTQLCYFDTKWFAYLFIGCFCRNCVDAHSIILFVIGSFIVTGTLIAKVMIFSFGDRMHHYPLFSMTIVKSFTFSTMLAPQLVTVISSCSTQLLSMLTSC